MSHRAETSHSLRSLLLQFFPRPVARVDEAALDAYLDDKVRFYGRGCALVLNCLHLLFWPTDRFLLPPEPAIHRAMMWFRASTFVVHALYLLAMLVPQIRRYPLAAFGLAAALSSALFGQSMAQMGGLDQPYFYMTYLAPLGVGAMPGRPRLRIWLGPAIGAVICFAYFGSRPTELTSPHVGAAIGCMVFAVIISMTIGQGVYLILRHVFLLGHALAQSRSILKEYTEHLEDKVAEHGHQLRRLANYREEAAISERARLAQELHDEVGQQLTALRYGVQAMKQTLPKGQTDERITTLEEELTQLSDSVRGIVTQMRPRILEERGLDKALQFLLSQATDRTGISCMVAIEQEQSVVIPLAQASATYRIVQESLTNALRHANPHKVQVLLKISKDAIRAEISDDGCGMPEVDMTRAGMGLFGMKERAVALGGQLDIESESGQGTQVRLHMPLP